MNRCGDHKKNLQLYLDDELSGDERDAFREHLETCEHCRAELEEEQSLSDLLRRARPLYSASEELRARVESIVAEEPDGFADSEFDFRQPAIHTYRRPVQPSRPTVRNWWAAVAGFAAIALVFAFVPSVIQRVHASEYEDTAVSTHRSYLEGTLPLEIITDSPEEIAAWFDGKVPFHVQLPASRPAPVGKPAYRLNGARLVPFKGGQAAMLVYHSQEEMVSLLVASSKSAIAANGDELRSNGLTFHYISKGGFNVVTWTNHDLTYALVSSFHGSAQHSCLVCHQNFADLDAFR
jgi:anti-sigma factor (TIGR02949 family)